MVWWQREVIWDLYGTVELETGRRQYRRAYISMAKKNAKSFLVGGMPLYHMICEQHQETRLGAYGAAAARDQAGIVFKTAAHLARKSPYIMGKIKIIDSLKRMVLKDGNGEYAVISADGNKNDGIEPSLAIIDELHRWRTKAGEELFQVLKKGTISRQEPLVVEITTAGEEHESPLWFSEYEYAQQVLAGALEDPHFYVRIWAADLTRIQNDPEYWKSREARVAANPSHEDLGGFLLDKRIVEEQKLAENKPETKPDYLRLNLNVPVARSETPAIDMDVWLDGPGDVDLREWPEYDVEYLIHKWGLLNRECVAGVDIAWTTDLTSVQFLFLPTPEDPTWPVLGFNWIPRERIPHIERVTRGPLQKWVDQRFMETTPGVELDVEAVIEKIKWGAGLFNLREVAFDRWGGFKSAANLKLVPEGYICVDIPQTFGGLSQATKKLIGLYMDRKLRHGNHPILKWNAASMALESDGADNVKPAKPNRGASGKRIDGMAALVTAMARAQFLEQGTIEYTGLQSVGFGGQA